MNAARKINVRLVNEFGDRRNIECDVADDATGSKVATAAIEIANARPPHGWPYGVPTGTWELVGFDAP